VRLVHAAGGMMIVSGHLVVDVPDGLYLRLSASDVEVLKREHPGFVW
jgi:hypothetical protein